MPPKNNFWISTMVNAGALTIYEEIIAPCTYGPQCLKWLRNVQKVTSVGNPFLALVGIPSIVKLSNFTM